MFIKKTIFLSWLLCLALVLSSSAQAARPLIIDTDVGVDDVMALLYLLEEPSIEVKAITLSCKGYSDCQPALKTVKGILQLTQHSEIVVAGGGQVSSKEAATMIIETVGRSSQPISILALGPLTNIALALKSSPQTKKKIHSLVIMGGALRVQGNLNELDSALTNRFAEWNFYLDPEAASFVLKQKLAIILVPLDLTNQVPIEMDFYQELLSHHQQPKAAYLLSLLQSNLSLLKSKHWYFWDPLAAVLVSDESLATYRMEKVSVILDSGTQAGRTIIDSKNGSLIQVAIKIDEIRFKQKLLHNLIH